MYSPIPSRACIQKTDDTIHGNGMKMASHLQSLTKAAFGSCTSLAKATRKAKTHNTTAQNVKHRVTGEVQGKIPKIRQQLRPLLDAIRAVESNNLTRRDGHGGAGIGPFRIDEQYYRDAWGPCSSSNDWYQCRKVEHAENTILMYWLRHFFEAVSKNDWEKLARVHYGGSEGLKNKSTRQYWTEIYRWLEQNHLELPSMFDSYKGSVPRIIGKPVSSTRPVLNMSTCSNRPVLADIGNHLPSKKDATQRLVMQDRRKLQHKQAIKNVRKIPHQTAILHSLQGTSSGLKGKGAKLSYTRQIDYVHGTFEGEKRNKFSFTSTSSIFEAGKSSPVNKNRRFSSAFSSHNYILNVWKFSSSVRRERAAVFIQSYFRMFVAKSKYKYMKSAVVKIQRYWRWYGKNKTGEMSFSDYNMVLKNRSVFHEIFSYHCNQASFVFPEAQDESETLQDDVDTLQSPEDLLYKGNISPSEEEQLLTQLADLLALGNDNSQEGFDHSKSGMSSEELGEFCFPLLQTEGESEKSTPVLSRIHSPRWKIESCTSVERENKAFRELVSFLPEWYNIRKLDFMEEGNNTAFMSIKLDETLPHMTDLISQRTQNPNSMSETVLSTANNGDHQCLHAHNFSTYPMEEKHERLLESGLGHSPPKKIHLDRGLDVNNQYCVDEMKIGEIWARNISFMERRGKAHLLYCRLFGRTGMESKISKLVPENNASKGTNLDSRKDFTAKKEIDRAEKASLNRLQVTLDSEYISKDLEVDANCFPGLMGKISSLEVFDHGKSTLPTEYHDPPLLGAVMFPCLFPEASFTSSAIAVLCSGLHSMKQNACPESAVQKGFKTKNVGSPH